MAKIVLSDQAPSEKVHFSLADADFDLGGNAKQSFETDEPAVIANANSHPWLEVDTEGVEVVVRYRPGSVDPANDPLSSEGPNAALPFDEKAVTAFEDSKVEEQNPVAIEAGQDQGEKDISGGVAETLASADEVETVVDESVTESDRK